jgi:hypothetical protein
MVNNHNDDGQGAKEIETGLALAIREARVDFRSQRSAVRGQKKNARCRRIGCDRQRAKFVSFELNRSYFFLV